MNILISAYCCNPYLGFLNSHKEKLDKCSACDMNCVVNNGLSEASKAQLVGRTGEEIVDADIAEMKG